MALITCQFFSTTLFINTSMHVILPESAANEQEDPQAPLPVLYLLHGLSDDDSSWVRRSLIERYASNLRLAVVMPNVHHSFYSNMEHGNAYWTFLTEELPRVASTFFPLSKKREEQFVAGLSMGGYGAFKWALSHPERFCLAGSFSGLLDIATHQKNAAIGGEGLLQYLPPAFGQKDISGTEHDLLHLLQKHQNTDRPRPDLYQCCGTEDFLYQDNKVFLETARSVGYPIDYEEGSGTHDWFYWDAQIQCFLQRIAQRI